MQTAAIRRAGGPEHVPGHSEFILSGKEELMVKDLSPANAFPSYFMIG
jgi:hypothetical protein